MLFTSTRTGPLSLATTMSVSPSLSRSPNAAPRPTSSVVNARPARSVISSKRPLPDVAKQLAALLKTEPLVGGQRFGGVRHRTVRDRQVEPSVVVGVEPRRAERGEWQRAQTDAGLRAALDEHARPVVHVQVGALPRQLADEHIIVAVLVEVAGVNAHARLEPPFRADRRARRAAPCS